MPDATLSARQRLRRRTYLVLEERESRLSVLVNGAIMLLIVANVAAIVLESVPRLEARYDWFFEGFERLSVAVFTIEYLARVWACVEDPRHSHPVRGRLRYMGSFMAIVDLAAILPFYLHSCSRSTPVFCACCVCCGCSSSPVTSRRWKS